MAGRVKACFRSDFIPLHYGLTPLQQTLIEVVEKANRSHACMMPALVIQHPNAGLFLRPAFSRKRRGSRACRGSITD
jgi:hypothetical protein